MLLTWLIGVSCGDTWLFLPDHVEVRDVGSFVVRLWSHVVAPVGTRCRKSSLPDGRGGGLFAVHCQQCEL
ncbi:hypothetical protein Taro_024335 [Colocasia esculenta]|uniref:Uncharacterized protein n=1 Tax=Colocasia esculenta TaxID=4460 RepID=A0A843VE61_COLES|nr:hypothetical protein [Colocasia esculenta]